MAAQKTTLSIAIATYNEEAKLAACLDSVSGWVDEIVIVDGGSSDETLKILSRYKVKIIHTDNPAIFHINKQKALDGCSGKWILQLDADEVVSDDLKEEILGIISNAKAASGYAIPRKNYFAGHWLSKGGQYPDYVIRLFQRGKGRFPAKSVHEQIVIDGPVGSLMFPLLHYTYQTVEEYWRKADAYTTLTARELSEQRVGRSLMVGFQYMLVKPALTFLSIYIRHKGFIDGYWGFLFAWYSALHYPIAYKKYLIDAS